MENPRPICDRRARQRAAELGRMRRVERAVSWSRLAAVVLAGAMAWLSVQAKLFPLAWAAAPALVFLALVVLHERVLRRVGRLERAQAFYRQTLERLDGDWHAGGRTGSHLAEEHAEHVYAADLDLFGPNSLFQTLSRARTYAGDHVLASWLLEPAPAVVARGRQQAVRELASRLDFRERLAVAGRLARSDLAPAALLAWAKGENGPALPGAGNRAFLAHALLGLAAAVNVLAVIGWFAWGWGPSPLLAAAAIQLLWRLAMRRRFAAVTAGVTRASRDLNLVAVLLDLIEREDFESPALTQLGGFLRRNDDSDAVRAAEEGRVDAPEEPEEPEERTRRDEGAASRNTASRNARRLQRLVDLLDSMRNAFFAPIGWLLLWTPQLAYAIDGWRRRQGDRVSIWLAVLAQVEALASMASWAFEHPHHVFPTILDPDDSGGRKRPVLDGRQLGHPLLPAEHCVANDVHLAGPPEHAVEQRADRPPTQCLVVSGSNMSGKSTLLRTVGANVVLALAGAPVRAQSLRLTPLAIGSQLHVQDSLADGQSRFYAEITKLKSVLDLTGQETPVLFLFDEILHGTNSHDRRLGAEALIEGLMDRGAIGLVTTHDLALAQIANAPGGKPGDSPSGSRWTRLRNVHFTDDLQDGAIHFDYRLREGTVTRSNALDLMRQVGLEV